MLIQLIGVLEDGSTRAATVPENPRKQINMERCTQLRIRLTAVNADGSPVALTGLTTALNIRRRSSDQPSLIRKTAVAVSGTPANVCEFTIDPADTRQFVPGRYVYDVALIESATIRNVLVPLSPFVVEPGLEQP